MNSSVSIFLGKDDKNRPVQLELRMANRHGLIAGAIPCAAPFQKWVPCS